MSAQHNIFPEQEGKIDERLKLEREHEKEETYPYNETIEDYEESRYSYYPNPNELSPEEEEFNDLFAEAVFSGAINTEPGYNKLTDPEAIRYRWQALFYHNPEETINKLKEVIK